MAEFTLSERIELLVEGELSPEQHGKLITELDVDPARWREVAFAFMEQKKLKVSVQSVIRENHTALHQPKRVSPPKAPSADRSSTLSLGRIIALAAVFLAVFSLGLATGRQRTSTFANVPEPAPVAPADAGMTPVLAPREHDPRGIVGYVHWESRVGIRRLPVFDGTASEQWLAENPPQIDARLARLLARSGWHVTPARRLVSMQFDSGDTFTIPIDDLTYQYVGQQVF